MKQLGEKKQYNLHDSIRKQDLPFLSVLTPELLHVSNRIFDFDFVFDHDHDHDHDHEIRPPGSEAGNSLHPWGAYLKWRLIFPFCFSRSPAFLPKFWARIITP